MRSEKPVNKGHRAPLMQSQEQHPKSQLSEHSSHLLALPYSVFLIARVIFTKAKVLRRQITLV